MENKENILKCALDLFYAKGYDAVGVQEIAEKAGITKPTLYYYFGSKYGLLETLLTTKFKVFRERFERVAYYNGNVTETLNRIAADYVDYAVNDQKFYMLLMSMFYLPRENEMYKAAQPLIKEFFRIVFKYISNSLIDLCTPLIIPNIFCKQSIPILIIPFSYSRNRNSTIICFKRSFYNSPVTK